MRALSFVSAVCLIAVAIAPQNTEAADYRFSPYFGMTFSQLAYDGDELLKEYYDRWSVDDKYGYGFTAGGVFSFKTRKESRISFESGLSYQLREGKTDLELYDETAELTTNTEMKTTAHYLSLPLFLKLQCLKNRFEPYIKLGAEFGFCLDASSVTKSSITNSSGETVSSKPVKDDITTSMKNPDVELVFAVGMDMPIRGRSGFVQFSYSHGLTDVNDPSGSLWDVKMKYRTFALSFGINFDL